MVVVVTEAEGPGGAWSLRTRSRMWTWWVSRSSSAPVRRSDPNTSVHSSKGRLVVTRMEPRS